MRSRNRVLWLGFVLCAVEAAAASDAGTVHEWGTFTSVAGENGQAVDWLPLSGPSDLPCFVERLDRRNLKSAYGVVRMETPILYFYPLKPMTVSVRVDFPNGRVTEWYPRASGVQPLSSAKGWIEWKNVQVSPSRAPLPKESAASHYYAARETDAWPLEIGKDREKFLFYRGLGNFGVDLEAVVNSEGVLIHSDGAERVPVAILFQNHGGKIGYKALRSLREPVRVQFADLSGGIEPLRERLESELIEMGLYRREARAMLETWRDSWFEEGMRVFYVLPRATVDTLLPLSIEPAPGQLARVFVGRLELLAPWMKQEIGGALASGDVLTLTRYGRFLNAFLREMSDEGGEPALSDSARQFLQAAYARVNAERQRASCGQ